MNYLHFSEEIYKIFYETKRKSINNIIEPIDLLLNMFKTKNLVSNILDTANYFKIFDKNIKNLHNVNCTFKFSKKSLICISNLIIKQKIINTVDLFKELINNNIYINYLFKFIQIPNLNIYNQFNIKSNITYIKNLFYYFNFKKTLVINRYIEINFIIDIISRQVKSNVILIGEAGIGRFSIIKGVFNKIKLHKTNINSRTKEFYVLDLIQFYSVLSQSNIQEYKKNIYNWALCNFNSILIITNIEYINNFEILLPIFDIICSLTKQNKLQIIITTNIINFSSFIQSYPILLNLYESLSVKELPIVDIYKVLQINTYKLEQFYKIKLFHNIHNLIIKISNLYYPHKVFPLKALELEEIICSKFINQYPTIFYLTNYYFEQIISNIKTDTTYTTPAGQIIKKKFKFELKRRIFGQSLIIDKISNSLQKAMLGFKEVNKPIGSWLLCGPSGTGKTELAKSIAEILFGTDQKMIRFDMSEFMEKHSVSKLIGSPPGYVGYGDKGLLTDSVHKHPYCLLLFDEIEKAHPDILNIMLQILDDGRLTDSTGKVINFSNTLIIFTSNLGCPRKISDFKKEFNNNNNTFTYKLDEQIILTNIKQYFRPELINRIQDILIFQPLKYEILLFILNKFINQFYLQLKSKNFPIKLIIQENLKKYLVKLSISPLYGARPLKRIFDELIIEPTLSILIKTKITKIHLLTYTLSANNNILYSITTTQL